VSRENGTSRTVLVPEKELNQLRKIADKCDRKGFDYPSRTTAARAAIYLAVHHEWTREQVIEALRQVGEDEEEPEQETPEPSRAAEAQRQAITRYDSNGGDQT
jgi:hypothetical protein